MKLTRQPVKPGDLYEDCAYHPALCYLAEPRRYEKSPWWRKLFRIADDWDISGISLLDGTRPRSCSVTHCAPHRLTLAEVVSMRGVWEQGRKEGTNGSAQGPEVGRQAIEAAVSQQRPADGQQDQADS